MNNDLGFNQDSVKRIVFCTVRCVQNELEYISRIDKTASYDFDSMQIHRISYIVMLLYQKEQIRLSDNLYKCIYYELGPLIKNYSFEEFYQEVTFDINVFRKVIYDFKTQLSRHISKAQNEESAYFACIEIGRARKTTLVYSLYDFEEYDDGNALFRPNKEQRCEVMNIIDKTINEYFPYYE